MSVLQKIGVTKVTVERAHKHERLYRMYMFRHVKRQQVLNKAIVNALPTLTDAELEELVSLIPMAVYHNCYELKQEMYKRHLTGQ